MSAFPLGKEKQNKKITTKVNQFKATAQGSQYALKKKKKNERGIWGQLNRKDREIKAIAIFFSSILISLCRFHLGNIYLKKNQ